MDLHESPSPGRVLEAAYLHRIEAERLRRLRGDCDRDRLRAELSSELQLREGALLERLLELGVTADTAAAFEALPLIHVAWADGQIVCDERWCVLRAATALGLELGSAAHAQLELWLRQPPDAALFDAWLAYAGNQDGRGPRGEKVRRLVDDLTRVAEAAGGVLGFRKVSPAERAAIARIEAALPRTTAQRTGAR